MSQQKKRSITHTKKYNPDSDIVPLHPTGFGVAVNENDDSIFILDFSAENLRHTTNGTEIILGSYAISKKMAEDIVKLLSTAIDGTKKENKEIKE